MEVDFTPLVEIAISLLAMALSTVAAVVGMALKAKFGIEIDTTKEGVLNRAIDRGLEYAENFVLGDDGKLSVPVNNMMVKWAAEYVIDKVPETLEHFKITEDRLREMILARLGHKTAAAKSDKFVIPQE